MKQLFDTEEIELLRSTALADRELDKHAFARATGENGCLQVIKGSHLMGRIDHVLTGDQAGADLERVNAWLKPEADKSADSLDIK